VNDHENPWVNDCENPQVRSEELVLECRVLWAIVAANTTMRGCELKGLQLRDVDLNERKLTIRRERTKTDAGCRMIPLNDTAF
jgi:integrase